MTEGGDCYRSTTVQLQHDDADRQREHPVGGTQHKRVPWYDAGLSRSLYDRCWVTAMTSTSYPCAFKTVELLLPRIGPEARLFSSNSNVTAVTSCRLPFNLHHSAETVTFSRLIGFGRDIVVFFLSLVFSIF